MPAETETLQEKIARVTAERVEIVPYDSHWPALFEEEKLRLRALPIKEGLIRRIEHFGSTAVPGLAAKPVIDLLVEVRSLAETREHLVPLLEAQGCDYFWRPTHGEDGPPWYAWFIRRADDGRRTHHIHMVEADYPHWDALLFRDWLRRHRNDAEAYLELKLHLAQQHSDNRIAYTRAKSAFIQRLTDQARHRRSRSR